MQRCNDVTNLTGPPLTHVTITLAPPIATSPTTASPCWACAKLAVEKRPAADTLPAARSPSRCSRHRLRPHEMARPKLRAAEQRSVGGYNCPRIVNGPEKQPLGYFAVDLFRAFPGWECKFYDKPLQKVLGRAF